MPHTLLFGGSFDPIHHGHLITAQAAAEALQADQVLLIPAHVSPHKLTHPADPRKAKTEYQKSPPPAPDQQRLAMIELAIQGAPGFAVDDLELRRPGPSFTIDTVEALQARAPGRRFTWLLGADQLPQFHRWHRIGDLLARIDFAILPRPGTDPALALAAIAEHLGPGVAQRLEAALLETPRVDISATQIRQRMAAGLPICFLVPGAVEGYIQAQHLYTKA